MAPRSALAIAILGLLAAAALADVPAGFDHVAHEKQIASIGTLACRTCHSESRGRLVGRPGHAACFGACHGPPPAPEPTGPTGPTGTKGGKAAIKMVFGNRAKVCAACHAPSQDGATVTAAKAASNPLYTIAPDFIEAFGHKRHAAIACTQCHDTRVGARGSRAPHDRCAGCHDGAGTSGRGPAMDKCAGCHVRATPSPSPERVPAVFSHAKHAARGTAGKDCAQCHRNASTSDSVDVPTPTMQSCAAGACHDGKAAFATTTSCTRCHDKAPPQFEVARPSKRFLHAGAHTDVVDKQACTTCHALGSRGDTVVASHSACAGTACHEADFAAREPLICGACHNSTEPWRPLVADRGPAERTEFGAMLDHDKHRQDCVRCHSLRTSVAQLRPPRGHAACTGAACHAATQGPAPLLAACDGCHRVGLALDRESARLRAPWSVRARFDHRTHARAPGTGEEGLPCTSCHTNLAGIDLVKLATPAKATCAPCHDAGKSAFKLTGTNCGRCHLERR